MSYHSLMWIDMCSGMCLGMRIGTPMGVCIDHRHEGVPVHIGDCDKKKEMSRAGKTSIDFGGPQPTAEKIETLFAEIEKIENMIQADAFNTA